MVDRVTAVWQNANEAQRWILAWGLLVVLPPAFGEEPFASGKPEASPGAVRVAACLYFVLLIVGWVWEFFWRKYRPESVRRQIGWWTNATSLYCVALLATMYFTQRWPIWSTTLPIYLGLGGAMYLDAGGLSPGEAEERARLTRHLFVIGIIFFVVRHVWRLVAH